MAVLYVDDGGNDSDGSSWANAYQSILHANVLAAAAGTTIYIGHNHKETAAATKTIAFTNSTYVAPIRIISVTQGSNPVTLQAGAEIEVTGTADISISGRSLYWYGVTLDSGDDINAVPYNSRGVYESCRFEVTDILTTANYYSSARFVNCEFDTKDADLPSMRIATGRGSYVEMINCEFQATGGVSSSAFIAIVTAGMRWLFDGCDLSARSGGALVVPNTATTYGELNYVTFRRCLLPDGFTVLSAVLGVPTLEVLLESCADGTITNPPIGTPGSDDLVSMQLHTYWGTVKSDLSHYRTGGADDGENANAYSWQMTSSAQVEEIYDPLRTPPITIWIAKETPSGATARGLYSHSTRLDPCGTPANITTDGASTWNGADVGTKQKLTHTLDSGDTLTIFFASDATMQNDEVWMEVIEPDQVGGPCSVVVCLAKASDTIYVDPKIEVT